MIWVHWTRGLFALLASLSFSFFHSLAIFSPPLSLCLTTILLCFVFRSLFFRSCLLSCHLFFAVVFFLFLRIYQCLYSVLLSFSPLSCLDVICPICLLSLFFLSLLSLYFLPPSIFPIPLSPISSSSPSCAVTLILFSALIISASA